MLRTCITHTQRLLPTTAAAATTITESTTVAAITTAPVVPLTTTRLNLRSSTSIAIASTPTRSSLPSTRSFHTRSSVSSDRRLPDGSWISDNTRPREREMNHFAPTPPKPITPRPMKPLNPVKRPHDKIAPFVNPVEGTHTLSKQTKKIRLQFQLEPVARTLAKPLPAAQNERIKDYTHAEVYTRAPWPAYREIILNRPGQLHSLNPVMIQQLNHITQSMEINKDITATLMISRHARTDGRTNNSLGVDKTTGEKRIPYEKTFSSGMDVHTLLEIIKETRRKKEQGLLPANSTSNPGLSKYFRSLYSFAWNINKLRTPLIIALDGLAVGAGAGFALHSRYRLATENTRISFPQASFGWFPDAGASYILPRLDGRLGLFFALTGWNIRALDATRLGLCTHYCESDELHRFGRRIGDSSLTYQFAEDTIEQAFGMFNMTGPSFLPMPIHDLHELINDLFESDSVEGILLNMMNRVQLIKAKGTNVNQKDLAIVAFIEEMQKRIMQSSPIGLKVTFELLRLTQYLPLEKCLQLEYRLAQGLLANLSNPMSSEIFNAPNFSAKTLAQVSPSFLQKLFQENPNQELELNLEYDQKKKEIWYI